MKITLKKSKVTQIINEEIEKFLLEQKKFKTKGAFIVRKQRNGNTYPGLQRMFDNRTLSIMKTLDDLKEAESGTWYKSKSADAEDYEKAYQEFIAAKGFLEKLQKIIKRQQRRKRKSNPEFAKWDFAKNYGAALPEAKEKYPNFITKITVEKSNLIRDGINPTVFFSDGSKKQYKTPMRPLNAINAARDSWKNSFLLYDGKQLTWRYRGNSKGLFDTSSPIGGPWAATSGGLDLVPGFLQRVVNLIKGRGFTEKESAELQKLKSFGPLPEGTYQCPKPKRVMESIPKSLRKSAGTMDSLQYAWDNSDGFGTGLFADPKNTPHAWHGANNVWKNVAWGNHRIALGNSASFKVDGKRYKADNLAKKFGRSGFYIHGGTVPGSSGCLDLGDDMDKFAKFWTENFIKSGCPKRSIPLVVRYSDKNQKMMADALGTAILKNVQANSARPEPEEPQSSGELADYDYTKYKSVVGGCRGGKIILPAAARQGCTADALYAALKNKLPQELLKQYPGFDVGKPGDKTKKLVAHFQAFHFKNAKEVDGCVGPSTWAALVAQTKAKL